MAKKQFNFNAKKIGKVITGDHITYHEGNKQSPQKPSTSEQKEKIVFDAELKTVLKKKIAGDQLEEALASMLEDVQKRKVDDHLLLLLQQRLSALNARSIEGIEKISDLQAERSKLSKNLLLLLA